MLKIAFSPIYKYDLAPTHRFPMMKYELIGEQLLYDGTATIDSFFHPTALSDEVICATHSLEYWRRLKGLELTEKEIRKIGFPMSQRLVDRCIVIAGGTVECARYALQFGVSLNAAGGTHHSFTDRGEGFCMLNDIAIAANYLLDRGLAHKILVVDLDVHQGNGTAEIFRGSERVFTFSMHGEKNYPVRKEESHKDIGLPDGADDAFYLKTLGETLPMLIDSLEPDFIFYNAGVDVLKTDKLGRLAVSLEGCRQRDKYVFETCKRNTIPIAVSMGGGYSERLATIVDAHANTFRVAGEVFF